MRKALILSMATFLKAAAAQSGSLTGNDMIRIMSGPGGATAFSMYVRGALDMRGFDIEVATRAGMTLKPPLNYCIPTEAIHGQIVDVVKQYLESNPDKRHMAMHTLTSAALWTAWPCGQPASSPSR